MNYSTNALDELNNYIIENEMNSSVLTIMDPGHYGTHKTPIFPLPSFLEIEKFIGNLKMVETLRRLHFRKLRGEIDAEFDIDRNGKPRSTITSRDFELLPPPPPSSMTLISSKESWNKASNQCTLQEIHRTQSTSTRSLMTHDLPPPPTL